MIVRGDARSLPIRTGTVDCRSHAWPRWSHEMIFLLTPWERTRRANEARPKWYPSGLVETGSVWHFPPGSSGDPHLAPFPDELARRCILPTTLPGDLVLDPFAGSDTVGRVAAKLGRRSIGVDLYAGRPDLTNGVEARPTNGWATRNSRRQDVGRHPTATGMAAAGLKMAEFYYAGRELAAGRPCPIKLTAEQLAYVERWLPGRSAQ